MRAPVCRICQNPSTPFFSDTRSFYRCSACDLIFTDEIAPPAEQETHYKAQWGNQQPDFWRQQADIILQVIRKYHKPRRILDFGAGSGALTAELRRRGLDCTPLEPMADGFLKDQRYPQPFDTVVGVEVIEHLLNLREELAELDKVLAPGGIMLFTTLLSESFVNQLDAAEIFSQWWYKNDPTHVSFFNYRSLEMLGETGGYDIDVIADQIVVLRKLA